MWRGARCLPDLSPSRSGRPDPIGHRPRSWGSLSPAAVASKPSLEKGLLPPAWEPGRSVRRDQELDSVLSGLWAAGPGDPAQRTQDGLGWRGVLRGSAGRKSGTPAVNQALSVRPQFLRL